MSINSRFQNIVDTLYKGNKRAFATAVDVSPTVIENVVGTRQGKPSYDVLLKISANANISPEWLLTGEGDMLRSAADEQPRTPEPVAQAAQNGIPLLPISAMAGTLSGESQVLEYECERYAIPVFKGAEFLVNVKGSSMYPKYNSGDIVACKKVAMDKLFFQWNKVYVLDTDQGALIKRIKKGSTSDSILIVSDNEKYDPFELPLSSIYGVALVIGVVRLE